MHIKIAVILIMAAMQLFDFFLKYLDYSNRNAPVPESVKDVFAPETYVKRNAYEMEKVRLSIVSGLATLVFISVILGLNVHSGFFAFIEGRTSNMYFQVYYMFAMVWLIGLPISVIFDAIGTFKIEAKYGFNKSTVGTFLADIVKSALLEDALINLGLLTLFLWLHSLLGNVVFLVFIFVVAAFAVIFICLRPIIIRAFYKLTPLEDGPLKDRVIALSQEADFPVKRVYVADGSRRTTKVNAFFSGFGKSRFIGLYDNLINEMTEDEVIYVLGHEIGHAKKKHMRRRMPMMLLIALPVLAIAYFVVNSEAVSLAFGFGELNVAFGMYIGMALSMPFIVLLQWPSSFLSRKHEYEADAFGAQFTGSEVGVTATKKLGRSHYANLTPHPFVVSMTYSHPPINRRVEALAALDIKRPERPE